MLLTTSEQKAQINLNVFQLKHNFSNINELQVQNSL